MSILQSSRLWNWLLYATVLALAVAALSYEGEGLPSQGDTLGPMAFPRYTAIALLCLLLIKIIQSRVSSSSSETPKNTASAADRAKIFSMLLMIIGFIALVALQWLPFWLCIALFLIASISFLSTSRTLRDLLPITAFAIVFGLALSYIVETFFYFSL